MGDGRELLMEQYGQTLAQDNASVSTGQGRIIKKKTGTYFGCTVAPDGNCAAHALVARPFFASPAQPAQHRCCREILDDAVVARRSFADSSPDEVRAVRCNRTSSFGENRRDPCDQRYVSGCLPWL
jgi:hypothetical protein